MSLIKMENKMVRAVIYGRVSTTNQNTETQLLELRDVCKRNNWNIIKEITDNGISGSKPPHQSLE